MVVQLKCELFEIDSAEGLIFDRTFSDDQVIPVTCIKNRVHFNSALKLGASYTLYLSEMRVTEKISGQVFDRVHLLRPVGLPISLVEEVVDVEISLPAVFKMTVFDSQRQPVPHAKITFADTLYDSTNELTMDRNGEVLVSDNPTSLTILVSLRTALLIERISS